MENLLCNMKIQSSILQQLFKPFATAIVSLTLLACEPISVGTWQTTIEMGNTDQDSTWIITPEPTLTISTNSEVRIEEVELAGSRINWSTDGENFPSLGIASRLSFNGTINGNELAGTLFTQQGNFTVTGRRLPKNN